ncbi:MAG: redoxin domain-containing protein [Chloroflexia bacterium]|nr:redoxin domain-containing protein [Chloroflexia bacterium]
MNQVTIGTKVSTLSLTDIWGTVLKIPDGEKWVYLSFHRFSACPLCNLRTHELIKSYDEFKNNNIEICSIWPSGEESMKEYVGKSNAPFPLIADPGMSVFRIFGVTRRSNIPMKGISREPKIWMQALKHKYKNFKVDGDSKLQPASFLINPIGEIIMAYYGKHFGDHVPIAQIIDTKEKVSSPTD